MHRTVAWLLWIVLVACPLPTWAAPEPSSPPCPASEEFTTPDETLDQIAASIAAGGPVKILAVGSATTAGEQAGVSQDAAYPQQLIRALRAALPAIHFELTVRGGRGMTAEQMLPLLEAAVATQKFDLVLWQTGTVEAVRGLRPDTMQDVLQEGIQRARDRNADVVLIDPQFSRFLRSNADLDPYETALQQASAMPDVVLFRRYELMREWADSGEIDLERSPRAERVKTMTRLNVCLGETLARFILNGAGVAQH